MRVIFTLLLAVIWCNSFGQAVFISEPDGGRWSADTTWTCAENCGTAGTIPGSGDIAVVAVDPGNSVIVNGNFAVADLYVVSDVAASIGREGFGPRTLTINGQLRGARPDLSGASEPPSVNVFDNSASSLTLRFTGSSASGPVITDWGHNAPIYNVQFDSGSGNLTTESFSFVTSLAVQTGTAQLNSGHEIRSTGSGSGNASIASGATMLLQGPVNGGSTSTGINSFVVTGTLTAQSAGYVNANTFTVSAGATFNAGFAGNEGWWHDDFPEPIVTLNPTSTVNYSANSNQNVYATEYGNVNFGGIGTKTIVGTGDFTVAGNISVLSSSVTLTSVNTNEKSAAGNVTVNGTWSIPSPFALNGTAAQTISGSGTINFAGGLQIANTGDVITLAKDVSVTGGLTIDPGATLNLASRALTLNGGTLIYNGTITADPGGAGGTLISTGTTAVTGTAASKTFNNLTVTGGTFTAPSSGMVLTGNLNITGGTFVAPSGTLDLAGNLSTVDNSSFDANSGTLNFNGVQNQTISGVVTANDITVTNTEATNGVLVAGTLNLVGVLNISDNATFDADGLSGNGSTILLSSADDPTIDGAIGILPPLATLEGNVTVQRYMSHETQEGETNNRIYRYISSPVANASVAQIQDDGIPVTGSFSGASTCGGCAGPSMYRYNEAVITDTNGDGVADLDDGFVPFPTTSNNEPLQRGRGYAIFVRGNHVGGSNAKWDVTGPIHKGFTNYPVTYTNTGSPENDGWNLVGNPYPSTIDWDSPTGWTRNASVAAAIHRRDHATGQVHVFVPGSGGTNGAQRYIPTGQAFWVQTTGPNPVLQSEEDVKAPGSQGIFYREDPPSNVLSIKLAREDDPIKDETLVVLRNDATAEGFDFHADAWKWKNIGVFNLSTLAVTGEDLAVNSIPDISCGTRIKLKVEDITPGSYALEFSGFDSFLQPVKVKLTDKFSNKTHVLSTSDTYDFSVTEDPNSFGSERFEITFLNAEPFPELQALVESAGTSCGPGAVELIASGAPEDGQYNWYLSQTDDNPVEGQHGATFVTPELQKTQTFYVAAVDSKGCLGPKVPVTAEVVQFDPITINESVSGILESNYTEGNQWYLDGQPIDGATGPTLVANESGTYRVESVVQEGCVTSAEYDFVITDLHEQNASNRFEIYPNPSKDFLKFSAPVNEKVSDVSLLNNVGAVVGKMRLHTAGGRVSGELDMTEVASGLYILRILGETSGVVTHKIIKN